MTERSATTVCAICRRPIEGRAAVYLKPDPWWPHSGKHFLSLKAHPTCLPPEPDTPRAA